MNILIDQFTPKVSVITVTTKTEDQACALSVHTQKKRPIAGNDALPATKNGKIPDQLHTEKLSSLFNLNWQIRLHSKIYINFTKIRYKKMKRGRIFYYFEPSL